MTSSLKQVPLDLQFYDLAANDCDTNLKWVLWYLFQMFVILVYLRIVFLPDFLLRVNVGLNVTRLLLFLRVVFTGFVKLILFLFLFLFAELFCSTYCWCLNQKFDISTLVCGIFYKVLSAPSLVFGGSARQASNNAVSIGRP